MKEEHIEQIRLYILETLAHPIGQEELILLYYQMGAYLCAHKISYRTLQILEIRLQTYFGIVIGFTRRNLMAMMQFSQIYAPSDFAILKKLSWNQHLYLLKIKDVKRQRKLLFDWVNYTQKEKKNYKKERYVVPNDYMVEELRKLQKN